MIKRSQIFECFRKTLNGYLLGPLEGARSGKLLTYLKPCAWWGQFRGKRQPYLGSGCITLYHGGHYAM